MLSNTLIDSARAHLADPVWKKVYWDSCAWLGKVNAEPDKVTNCDYWLLQAQSGECEIFTSSITLAEVFKVKCNGVAQGVSTADDQIFQDLIEQPWVVEVQCDHMIAAKARQLLRKHPELKKPTDAIHLATALLNDCDVMFTYDAKNLTVLSEREVRSDGVPLKIMLPPPDPQASLFAAAAAPNTPQVPEIKKDEAKPPEQAAVGAQSTAPVEAETNETKPITKEEVNAAAEIKPTASVAQKPAEHVAPVGAVATIDGRGAETDAVETTSTAAK